MFDRPGGSLSGPITAAPARPVVGPVATCNEGVVNDPGVAVGLAGLSGDVAAVHDASASAAGIAIYPGSGPEQDNDHGYDDDQPHHEGRMLRSDANRIHRGLRQCVVFMPRPSLAVFSL